MVHHMQATWLDMFGAVLLLLWAAVMWATVFTLMVVERRGRGRQVWRGAQAVVLVGVVGQIGHLAEHVAQVGHWVADPNAPGWMTPWGSGLARGFGRLETARPALGMEILHLVGNMIFLAGPVGVMVLTCRAPGLRARRWARMGVLVQGLHGLEHLALTLSVWFGAPRAIGFSTWFGAMHPGPGLWTYRVWWHFLANVVGSAVFAAALWFARADRKVIEDSFAHQGSAPRGRRRHAGLPRPAFAARQAAGPA